MAMMIASEIHYLLFCEYEKNNHGLSQYIREREGGRISERDYILFMKSGKKRNNPDS